MAREVWAAYAASAYGSEITLHNTEREALDAVVAALGLDTEDRGLDDDSDDEDIREALDDYCSGRADDWDVQSVTVPPEPADADDREPDHDPEEHARHGADVLDGPFRNS